jgi:hypothetical protein
MTELQRKQMMVEDAMVIMAGDMFQSIYNLPNNDNYIYVTELIKHWATEFVKQLDWQGDDDERDWLIELENFEQKEFDKLAEEYKDDDEYKQVLERDKIKQVLEGHGLVLGNKYAAEALMDVAEEYKAKC